VNNPQNNERTFAESTALLRKKNPRA